MNPTEASRYELASYAQLANARGVTVKTIQNWVWADRPQGIPIPFAVCCRGTVRFRVADALAFFDRHIRFQTDPRKGRKGKGRRGVPRADTVTGDPRPA